MADDTIPISALPSATLPLTGDELVPLVQSAVTVKTAVRNLPGGSASVPLVGCFVNGPGAATGPIPAASEDTITFQSAPLDSDSFFNPAVPGYIRFPRGGCYHVGFDILWGLSGSPVADGSIVAGNLAPLGGTAVRGATAPYNAAWKSYVSASTIANYNTGDVVTVNVVNGTDQDLPLEDVNLWAYRLGDALPVPPPVPPPPPPPPFDPPDAGGLRVWLHGDLDTFQDTSATVPATATPDPVEYWGDQSGNGNHVVISVAGSDPTLEAGFLTGSNGIRFAGALTTWLQAAANATLDVGNEFTIFVVIQDESGSVGDHGVVSKGTDAYGTAVESGRYYGAKSGAVNLDRTSVVVSGAPHIIGWGWSGSADFMRVDGADVLEGLAGGTCFDNGLPLQIGADNSIIPFNGVILHVLVYDHCLSLSDAVLLETWLNNLYAIF